MINKINFLYVTLFGIGKLKKIPGSYASLATTIFLFILFHIFKIPVDLFLFMLILIFIISIFSINSYIKNSDNKDPKEIVIDEFIGQSIPISLYELAHPVSNEIEVITFYFIMFILFRILDITKPYPANYYDKRIKNGFGVIMDDVVAGLYVVAIMVLFMVGKSNFF
tara:strand:- start:1056 stop:1556 length:501 start_codon:yes stop_codon:yes gene_type:complete